MYILSICKIDVLWTQLSISFTFDDGWFTKITHHMHICSRSSKHVDAHDKPSKFRASHLYTSVNVNLPASNSTKHIIHIQMKVFFSFYILYIIICLCVYVGMYVQYLPMRFGPLTLLILWMPFLHAISRHYNKRA